MFKQSNLTVFLIAGALALLVAFTPLACTSDTNDETDLKQEVESTQQNQTAEKQESETVQQDQTNVKQELESTKQDQSTEKQESEAAQQDQTAEKRKELFEEATTAIRETKNALKALDENKSEEALAALERASGKLTIILGREPELALAPSDVNVVTYNILADIDAVKELRDKIEDMLDDGYVQQARRLIKNLASETVISVTNIPLATYPDAIKKAARLIDDDKIGEAKNTLQTALNTMVITETIIPLPIVSAQKNLKEAESLTENTDRSEEENERLEDLLKEARTDLEFAQALGYGSKKDFSNLYNQLDQIEEKTKGGKSGTGFFDKIKGYLKDTIQSSQTESGTTEVN
jgi:chromosome segregation ATPase